MDWEIPVPAKVEGKWVLHEGGEFIFKQDFQVLSGTMTVGSQKHSITEGILHGNEISFSANGQLYTGLVEGDRIEGTFASGGKPVTWSAKR